MDPVSLVARPVPRDASDTDRRPLAGTARPRRPAGTLALPDAIVLPAGTRRGALRPDSAGDAGPRRLGRAALAGRALPRQAAAVVLAGDARLPRLRRVRGAGPVDPGP